MQPEPAHRALAQIGRLYAVEREAHGLINGKDLTKEQAWRAWLQTHAEAQRRWSRQGLPTMQSRDETGDLVNTKTPQRLIGF